KPYSNSSSYEGFNTFYYLWPIVHGTFGVDQSEPWDVWIKQIIIIKDLIAKIMVGSRGFSHSDYNDLIVMDSDDISQTNQNELIMISKKDVNKQNHTNLIISQINGSEPLIPITTTPNTNYPAEQWPLALYNFKKKKNQIQHDLEWEELSLRIKSSLVIYTETLIISDEKQ
ncbi:15107_t:CDS:2, partial [Dentiscutata erythropus]